MNNDQVLKIELSIRDKVLKTYSFTQDSVDIGRISSADIFIDNSSISREHTRIERSIGGPYIVKDMGSTNGTFVNDRRITETTLKNKDIINIGKFTLKVLIESKEIPKKKKASRDDFDGTTVLSVSQLERLHASVLEAKANDPDFDPDYDPDISDPAPPSLLRKNKELPTSQVLFWISIVILVGIIIGLVLIP
jgi:pSer/pThr/pTyr-binding forkhead associated (FHA) protein